jgi:NAD(P)-dependent dehydrogenase (short-subunit alcohol dehydrogenase family)
VRAAGGLARKRALVTGAGIGIGRGIAAAFARQGAGVVLHYAHSAAGAEETVAEIVASGGTATAMRADLGDAEACLRLVDDAADFLGGLDILVNNSGVTFRRPFGEITPAEFDEIFHINIRAQFFCAQRAARRMDANPGGAILNLTSIHAHGGVPEYAVYAATKGAIVSFTRQLAIELIPRRIRVNAVAPGHVEVPRHLANPNYSREYGESIVPWGRVGTPEDVAQAALFLVSDAADFVTGQVLYVDGGTTAKLAIAPAPITR